MRFNWFNRLQFECQIGDGHVAEYCVELGRKKQHHFGASVSTLKIPKVPKANLEHWRTKLQIQIQLLQGPWLGSSFLFCIFCMGPHTTHVLNQLREILLKGLPRSSRQSWLCDRHLASRAPCMNFIARHSPERFCACACPCLGSDRCAWSWRDMSMNPA